MATPAEDLEPDADGEDGGDWEPWLAAPEGTGPVITGNCRAVIGLAQRHRLPATCLADSG